jgi:hypothetical protein
MPSAAKQLFQVSEERLTKLVGQGTYPGAQAAWERALAIREAGGRPACFYSEFNGFTVLDEHDPDTGAIQRLISMEQRAKQFPG